MYHPGPVTGYSSSRPTPRSLRESSVDWVYPRHEERRKTTDLESTLPTWGRQSNLVLDKSPPLYRVILPSQLSDFFLVPGTTDTSGVCWSLMSGGLKKILFLFLWRYEIFCVNETWKIMFVSLHEDRLSLRHRLRWSQRPLRVTDTFHGSSSLL